MSNTLRNVVAVIVGLVVGGALNMAIVKVGPMVIPPPGGADMTTVDGLKAVMPLLEPKHFISPFLAHALGTLVGALIAYLIGGTHKTTLAYIVGVFFLIGGITAAFLIPAPMWFILLDLIVAYLPMAWLATVIGSNIQGSRPALSAA